MLRIDSTVFDRLREYAVPLSTPVGLGNEDSKYESTDDTNRPLTVITANHFLMAWSLSKDDLSLWDQAVLKFVESLPLYTQIILYWY